MTKHLPLSPGSVLHAPMEGITDGPYRLAILKTYPEWDLVYTDFLRAPSNGRYSKKHIMEHMDERIHSSVDYKNKTVFQILTTENALHIETLETIAECDIKWVDLNLGCPSKTVTRHKGGSFLLQDLGSLEKVIREIRRKFSNTFTVKTRIGYHDDKNFSDLIKLFCNEGVDAITIHARTRDQLYHGIADWNYIAEAVKISSVPIIGNGDIWTTDDIQNIFKHSGCHSVMLGRGALKTPWLARLYKSGIKDDHDLRAQEISYLFKMLKNEFELAGHPPASALKRLKSICRFMFDDLPQGATLKRALLLSQDINAFNDLITSINNY